MRPLATISRLAALLAILMANVLAQQPASPSAAAPGHIPCEHAAPPPGSHWVCDNPDQPCQCHLESNVRGRPIFSDGVPHWRPISAQQKAAGEAGCKRVSVKHFVAPFYPEIARLGQVQGTIIVFARLDAEGHVTSALPEGPIALAESAFTAVRQWTFHNPAHAKSVTIAVKYSLQQKALTTNTPLTDVSADLPCVVEVSALPTPPIDQ